MNQFFTDNQYHELITQEIQDDIIERIKKEQLTPGYVLTFNFKDATPTLSRYMTRDELIQAEKGSSNRIRFPAYRVGEEYINNYLLWFSAVILGASSLWSTLNTENHGPE